MGQQTDVTTTIVEKIAGLEDTSPTDLPPLADYVSADIAHRLPASDEEVTERLDFKYLWYQVTIHLDGEVTTTH